MIDREKVIKGLPCLTGVPIYCETCPYSDELGFGYGDRRCAEKCASDALALLKEQGWYLLTEDADGIIHGLPGDDGQYLMTDGKDIWIDEYVDGVADGIFLDSGRDIRDITAWMYMPELPKKERQ